MISQSKTTQNRPTHQRKSKLNDFHLKYPQQIMTTKRPRKVTNLISSTKIKKKKNKKQIMAFSTRTHFAYFKYVRISHHKIV